MKRTSRPHILVSALCALAALSCGPPARVTNVQTNEYIISTSGDVAPDSSVEREIRPYREKLSADMSAVLAESATPLEKGQPESRLGNLVAGSCLEISNRIYSPDDNRPADFSFFNTGGLRRELPQGKITRGDIYELMPFENELVVLTMNGKLIKKLLNFIASKNGGPVAGVRFRIRDREASDILVRNVPLDTTADYKAVTSDYLANGGDQFSFLTEATRREYLNMKVRDAIIQYLTEAGRKNEMIRIETDGRIRHE